MSALGVNRVLVALSAIIVLTGVTSVGLAQPAAQVSSGRDIVRRAVDDEGHGRWADALDKFEQVAAIKETASLRYHIGLCHERLGKLADALNDYDRAMDELGAASIDTRTAELLSPRREELHRIVPTLSTGVAPDVSVTRLAIDGTAVPVGMLGRAVPLDPGEHELVLEATGRVPYRATVKLAEGQHLEQTLDPEKVPAAPVAIRQQPAASEPTRAPPDRQRASRTGRTLVVIGEGAIAAAGVAMVIVGRFQASSANATIEPDTKQLVASGFDRRACGPWATIPAPTSTCGQLSSALDAKLSADRLSTAGAVLAAAGGIAAGATWLLWKIDGIERVSAGVKGSTVVVTGSF